MGTALEINHLWKKFRRGEFNDCLRDAIPAWVKSCVGRGPKRNELTEKDFWVLKDLDFKVEQGETLGIIGHNGAGKSTLLKILSNILEPTRGSIHVNGRLRALIEIGSGFHGDLTGRENIYLNGAILGMKHKEIDANFDSIVEFSGVGDFLDTPVKRYSSGMFARLGFAVAAHLEPDILIVDEVLSVGDAAFQKKCLGKMNEVAQSGRTVLFISHNMTAVRNLCSRVMLLDHGEIKDDGPASDVVFRYLRSLESQRNTPIAERTDRQGTGQARITNLLIGTTPESLSPNGMAIAGEKLLVRVVLEAAEVIFNPAVVVSFMDPTGETQLINLYTRFLDKPLILNEGKHTINFEINNFPLPEGEYPVGVGILSRYEFVDFLQNCCQIQSQYSFSLPHNYSVGNPGLCLCDFTWEET